LLLASVAFNYEMTQAIEKRCGTRAKILLATATTINLAVLGVFKYSNFLISTVNGVAETELGLTSIILPWTSRFVRLPKLRFWSMSIAISRANSISFATCCSSRISPTYAHVDGRISRVGVARRNTRFGHEALAIADSRSQMYRRVKDTSIQYAECKPRAAPGACI
jgi:hypothetical protein